MGTQGSQRQFSTNCKKVNVGYNSNAPEHPLHPTAHCGWVQQAKSLGVLIRHPNFQDHNNNNIKNDNQKFIFMY